MWASNWLCHEPVKENRTDGSLTLAPAKPSCHVDKIELDVAELGSSWTPRAGRSRAVLKESLHAWSSEW